MIEQNIEVKAKLMTRELDRSEFDECIVCDCTNGLPGFEELHGFIIIDDNGAELRRDPGPVTANMKAPVILNHNSRSDIEVVFDSDRYSTECGIN